MPATQLSNSMTGFRLHGRVVPGHSRVWESMMKRSTSPAMLRPCIHHIRPTSISALLFSRSPLHRSIPVLDLLFILPEPGYLEAAAVGYAARSMGERAPEIWDRSTIEDVTPLRTSVR